MPAAELIQCQLQEECEWVPLDAKRVGRQLSVSISRYRRVPTASQPTAVIQLSLSLSLSQRRIRDKPMVQHKQQ